MKRIGILNFQYSTHNYGAVLQAAALEHMCSKLGHDVQHLDYRPANRKPLRRQVRDLLRRSGLTGRTRAGRDAEMFERFRRAFIKRTPRVRSARQFASIARRLDAVIVGSDQVWRPAFARDILAFFLGYVPDGVARISYAASFGAANWQRIGDEALLARLRPELRRFKAVSCREDSGVEICRENFGVDALHVLDPLLAVDDAFLECVAERASIRRSGRLVYYKLDPSPGFLDDIERICAALGSAAVDAYRNHAERSEYREVWDWLALIRGAEVVVTDSYHCTCLALRFAREVYFCPNESRGSARFDSLFRQLELGIEPLGLGLNGQFFKLQRQRDFRSLLETERARSWEFLANAIND